MTPNTLHFTPALPCVDCLELTTLGLISPMSSQVWPLLPLCERDIETSAGEEEASNTITHHLQVIHHLQRRRRHLAQTYLYLRRQHAHRKAQRALRIGLNRSYRRQAKMREEGLL